MEAASKGAAEAGGKTLGFTINFPRGQVTDKYVQESYKFNYFFIRKAILTFSAQAFIFFPGGYGTADELFNILNLTQTEKIPRVPIILIGKDFWEPLQDFMKAKMLEHHHTISEEDMGLFTITDDLEAAVRIIGRGHIIWLVECDGLGYKSISIGIGMKYTYFAFILIPILHTYTSPTAPAALARRSLLSKSYYGACARLRRSRDFSSERIPRRRQRCRRCRPETLA